MSFRIRYLVYCHTTGLLNLKILVFKYGLVVFLFTNIKLYHSMNMLENCAARWMRSTAFWFTCVFHRTSLLCRVLRFFLRLQDRITRQDFERILIFSKTLNCKEIFIFISFFYNIFRNLFYRQSSVTLK